MSADRRCAKRVPSPPTPLGWTREAIATSPRYRHLLEPGAQCEHATGHVGAHKAGSIVWHDPAALFARGRRVG